MWKCNACGKKFSSKDKIIKHLQETSEILKLTQKRTKLQKKIIKVMVINDVQQHNILSNRIHSKYEFLKCPICKKKFKDNDKGQKKALQHSKTNKHWGYLGK